MKKSRPGTNKTANPAPSAPAGNTPRPASTLLLTLWCLAAIPSLLAFGYKIMAGGDLWWHLATGRWILEHKSLPLVDSWSFTRNGQPWLQHEWLSDVLYQLVVTFFGLSSLAYLKWLILVVTFLCLFRVLWRLTNEPVSSYASVLLAIAVAAPFLDIRPQLFSALGYVVLLGLTLPRKKPSLWIPLLFLVWVNLHAGFFFGLMALFVLLLPSIALGLPADRTRALIILACSAVACLINPNGTGAFAYPLKYAFDRTSPFKTIGEWLPPFLSEGIHSPLYPYAIALFVCASVFLIFERSRRKDGLKWAALLLGFLTLAMSLISRRFIILFAISQSLATAPALAALITPRIQKLPRLIAPALVALGGIALLWPYPLAPYAFHYLTAEDEFPVETCNFIELNHLSGNVFSYYNWGGYLHLRTNGQMKVFIDGRADTVYDSDTLRRYATVQGFRPGWEDIVENSGAQYILWPRDDRGKPMAKLVSSGRWQLLFDDFVSVLMVRTDQAPAAPLTPTPDSAYKRLTLGVQNIEQHHYDIAETALQGALEQMPYLRNALAWLAFAQVQQGKEQEARQTRKRAQHFFPLQEQAANVSSSQH